MKMKQREILGALKLDFARENQTQAEYIEHKIEQIKTAAREYLNLTHMSGYILGLSGGIDSYAAAALVADAILGNGQLHILLLPNGTQSDFADSEECRDALLAQFVNIDAETISIEHAYTGVVEDIKDSMLFDPQNIHALGNIQARLRMVEQYALNRGLLVIGTDHATENITGYFTKHGDGASDFNPLDGLLKPDIYAISKIYHAPECVMTKKPAAGLGISQNDEQELGISYDDLVHYMRGNVIDKEKMQRIVSLYEGSMHKRMVPASPMNNWWKIREAGTTHIIIDMIHDFVDGSLKCSNGEEALSVIISHINNHPNERVMYVRDCHPENHCSFKDNGGEWPSHAVEGTEGDAFMEDFYKLEKTINTPLTHYNVFDKGMDCAVEEYSGFNAKNSQYGALKYNITPKVLVSGIATEYCVKSTVADLLKNGFEVCVLANALGCVDASTHVSALNEMRLMGAKLIYN